MKFDQVLPCGCTVTGTLKIATLEGVFTGAEIDLTGCDHACGGAK